MQQLVGTLAWQEKKFSKKNLTVCRDKGKVPAKIFLISAKQNNIWRFATEIPGQLELMP